MNVNRDFTAIAADVRLAQEGDRAAMDRIIADVQDSVYYTCLSILHNYDAAQDVTQDVLCTVFTKLDFLKNPGAYVGWVNRITANYCKTQLKRNGREVFLKEDEDGNDPFAMFESVDEQTVPEKAIDNAETQRMILELVNKLPDEQRMCVMLYYYNQMKTRDIADALDVSEGTVKSRLNYARKSIKEGVLRYEAQGIKLYGISPVALLTYYLGRAESANRSPITVEAVRAAAGKAAGSAASASGAGAATGTGAAAGGKSALLTLGRIATVILCVGAFAGIGFGVYKLIGGTKKSKPAPASRDASMSTPVPDTPEPDDTPKPDDTPEPSAAPATPSPAPTEVPVTAVPATSTPEPTEEPVREVAILKDAKRNSNGIYLRNQTFKGLNGDQYLSENSYTMTDGTPDDYFTIPLDGQYSRFKGGVCLTEYYNGDSTAVFQIIGDGEKLFEQWFPEPGKLMNKDLIPFDIDVLGVEKLRLKLFSAHDSASPMLDELIVSVGLSEVVAVTATAEELAALPEKTPVEDDRVRLFDLKVNISLSCRAITRNGILYDSGNTFSWSNAEKDPNRRLQITLAGNYTKLTGTIAPLSLYNPFRPSFVFQIRGDGEVLFEKQYPNSEEFDWSVIPFEVDVTGVDSLTLHWINLNDGTGGVCEMGLIDFLLTPVE